jgi:hypothetical protein
MSLEDYLVMNHHSPGVNGFLTHNALMRSSVVNDKSAPQESMQQLREFNAGPRSVPCVHADVVGAG